MMYNDFQSLRLSALGFGAMRLPVLDGDDSAIDVAAPTAMVKYAIEHGVNYFDTAWGYHGGNSETVMGNILGGYRRDDFYLASKFPGYSLANMDKVEPIFEKQLEKCGVDYFDFYLLHNVCEMNIDAYLDESYGILGYLLKQKKAGRIRHLGFSEHGSYDVMARFLDAYGSEMEFGQIQINYLDWTFQNAEGKVELLRDRNIPVWVMEPLRGGKLANLPEQYAAQLKNLRPDESIPAWAFRFLQTIPGVTVTLSGMSNLEQLMENIRIFETDNPLDRDEIAALRGIAEEMVKKIALPCTACRYCVSHCPRRLDIPGLISLYNEHCFTENGFIAPMALMAVAEEKKPAACIACRQCEEVCPQQIKIADAFADFARRLG